MPRALTYKKFNSETFSRAGCAGCAGCFFHVTNIATHGDETGGMYCNYSAPLLFGRPVASKL